MGMFDSFYDADGKEWQTKAYDRLLERWSIGDTVTSDDNYPKSHQVEVYHPDAYATIRDGVFVEITTDRDESLPLVGAYGGLEEVTDDEAARLRLRLATAEQKLGDPWDLEGNAAATAWKKRVDAVQAWADQEYGDASAFPTGLVFALFGSVAAELHEVGASDDRS